MGCTVRRPLTVRPHTSMPDISFQCPSCSGSLNVPGEMANQLMECPSCKQTIEVPVRSCSQMPDSGSFTVSASEDESVFFQSGNITVTNARFIVGAKTFAMRSVTSVTSVQRVERKEEPLGITGMGCLSFIILMLGLAIASYGFGTSSVWLAIFGILIIGSGVWLIIGALLSQPKPKTKTIFTVVLTTAGGEVAAY